MKKLLLIVAIIFITATASAQVLSTSPFKHIPPPSNKSITMGGALNHFVTAYRFTLPFAGFSPITKQISTGLGYGWNKMHYIDSTATYYTDVSIFGAIFLNGNLTPNPYNFTSVGLGVGVLNNLIMIVPAYNLPNADHRRGAFDLKISFGLTLK